MAEDTPEDDGYTLLRPWRKLVEYQNGTTFKYEPLWDISVQENHHSIEFRLNTGSGRGSIDLEPSALSFCELFFPDPLIDTMVEKTNSYATSRLPPSRREPINRAELLRFFAIYYYMGLVRLPSRRDYWKGGNDGFWPAHHPCMALSRERFEYIWRNLHFVGGGDGPDEESNVDEEQSDNVPGLDAVMEEEDIFEDDDDDDAQGEDSEEDVEQEVDSRWYKKAALFLEHVSAVSARICKFPGSRLSIDEMMKRFKGRALDTVRMKNKPIKEGYKFFAIADAETGFVYDMIPDGRLEKRTIHDTVLFLAGLLPMSPDRNYVIAMDNYFTRPNVLTSLTEIGIGCVGTARYARGWPPMELKSIQDDRFNTVYTIVDKGQFMICRWIDNNQVTMVTNVHTCDESITRTRRRPRKNSTNRGHVELVWGASPTKEIDIPGFIDDYNHWMLGVDKADQLIAYYRPNLRCRRNWMPLLFHALDVARINSFIAATSLGWTSTSRTSSLHKDFLGEFIKSFLARATSFETRRTRRRGQDYLYSTPSPPAKRRRTSTKNPKLPDHRLYGEASDHIKVDSPKQGRCVMCSYLYHRAIKNRQPLPKIRRPKKWCLACKDHLCNEHFQLYHTIRTP